MYYFDRLIGPSQLSKTMILDEMGIIAARETPRLADINP